MKIAVGSDHAGFKYKEMIRAYLYSRGIEVVDFGTSSEEPCDYPDFIFPVAKAVRDKTVDRGIVLGGSGNGEAIAANRIKGVRACVCWNLESAELARRHNDSNVLSLGQRMIPEGELVKIVQIWLETSFEGGRHTLRLEKIEQQAD
ncbi:MAG: ribose 5-phosphate isomerase B [Pseudobdellovibrionaceae bacterium]